MLDFSFLFAVFTCFPGLPVLCFDHGLFKSFTCLVAASRLPQEKGWLRAIMLFVLISLRPFLFLSARLIFQFSFISFALFSPLFCPSSHTEQVLKHAWQTPVHKSQHLTGAVEGWHHPHLCFTSGVKLPSPGCLHWVVVSLWLLQSSSSQTKAKTSA